MTKKVRIGCASAFYGDSQIAARQLVDRGDIDYLVFDYLAEATMAILARAKMKSPQLGYAVDFVSVAMRDVLGDCAKQGIKVVANAGGVNVPACIEAIQQLCVELQLDLTVGGVYGDDLSDIAGQLRAEGLTEAQSGQPLPEKLASINAYLGAAPVAAALAEGADIVVTGRVVDSAVVLGPLMYEFNWQRDAYNELAQGSLAGHIIECGAQCTGGNYTDWHEVSDFADISYPIAEVSEDGSFVIDIPNDSGGLATVGSVGEQLLYEIGDPANYLLPDVACDFSHVKIEQIDKDRVGLSGALGRAPGNQYKVCATWVDGYRLMNSFFMAGPRAADKARTALDAWIKRTRQVFAERGWDDYRRVSIEIAGAEDTYGPHSQGQHSREVMGKYGVHHDNKDALVFASMEMAYLATSGPPAMTGFGAGRVRPQPLMRVYSSLVDKSRVPVKVQVGSKLVVDETYTNQGSAVKPSIDFSADRQIDQVDAKNLIEVPLARLVYGR
ncbi:MAG: acyclic terpene utilization AtuA family protein, partial [Pseudomonadota bacterium]